MFVCCVLFAVCCSLLVAGWLSPGVCLLFLVRFFVVLLFSLYCLLCLFVVDVRCSLFVACCLMFDVRCYLLRFR